MCICIYMHDLVRPVFAIYLCYVSIDPQPPPPKRLQPKTGAMKIHLAKWFDPWMSGGNQFSDAIFTYANKELKELKVWTRVPAVLVVLRCLYFCVRMHTCVRVAFASAGCSGWGVCICGAQGMYVYVYVLDDRIRRRVFSFRAVWNTRHQSNPTLSLSTPHAPQKTHQR